MLMGKNKLMINNFKFGIELESNLSPYDAQKYTRKGWKLQREHCGSEIISPILEGYKGLLELRRQVKLLSTIPVSRISFERCGLHVHIDIQDFCLGDLKRLLILSTRFNNVIFALMDGNRWDNRHAKQCGFKEKDIHKIKEWNDIRATQPYGRYHGLNLHAFEKHGTAEFRYASGTFNWQIVYSLTAMYLRMVALARSVDGAIPKRRHVSINTLSRNKETFFDALGLKGHTRKVLNNLFDKNKNSKKKTDYAITELPTFIGCMSK